MKIVLIVEAVLIVLAFINKISTKKDGEAVTRGLGGGLFWVVLIGSGVLDVLILLVRSMLS